MQAFSMLDTDDTGVLSAKDITRLMNRLMGRKLDEMQIAEIMSEICNSDAPGVTIDFETFYASLKPVFDAGEDGRQRLAREESRRQRRPGGQWHARPGRKRRRRRRRRQYGRA